MIRKLEEGFRLFELEPAECLDSGKLKELEERYGREEGCRIPRMPMQVHDILTLNRVIEDPALCGRGEECMWVSDRDWAYVCPVRVPLEEAEKYQYCGLRVGGVDTFADIYWNGEKTAEGEDVYLPLEAGLSGRCREENWLILHIHSSRQKLEKMDMPQRYRGREMPKWALFRGFFRGYDDYLGYGPYLTRMGVYDEICLEYGEKGIRSISIQTGLEWKKGGVSDTCSGWVFVEADCYRKPKRKEETLWICELEDGEKRIAKWEELSKEGRTDMCFRVESPRLWNVVHKGEPFLYRLSVILMVNGREAGRISRRVGFRRIERLGDFHFQINGMPLRLWGANVAPLDNKTGCYQEERAKKIVKMALEANMNCLRIWGGGDRLPDRFYDMCDEAGILLWQDFFHDYSMYPEEEAFRSLCRREAEYQVKRLRHHPSVLLWCGSNESMMCRDFSNPGRECAGTVLYEEDYRRICALLDPERYYHVSSPSGGGYANDPLEGDTHSYTSAWFVPGGRYPVFLSENMRAYPPVYHSMVRMMGKKALWPEGERGQMTAGNIFPWPKSWRPWTSAESWKKIAPVERFYDADDVESMIYRFGGSVGKYITECVGRYRRGRSFEEREQDFRRCRGHLWWKMNTSAPHIYSGLLDYYMEPYIPYYAIKRAYQPFQLFFSVDDYIGLWAVNDTIEESGGMIRIRLFHMKKNTDTDSFVIPFEVKPDQCVFLTDLNRFGQFLMNEHVLYAQAVDEKGKVLTEIMDYADIERHMEFPDCKLTLSWEGETLLVETDRFARSVELLGEEEGDFFGWEFEDNYFDLLPGRVKRVRISGIHERGVIHAKAHYATRETRIRYQRRKRDL